MSVSSIEVPEEWAPSSAVAWFLDRIATRYDEVLGAHPELADRLNIHLADAWAAFSTLYGTDAEAAEWFVRAVDAAIEDFRERPAPPAASTNVGERRPTGFRRPNRWATRATWTGLPARSMASGTKFRT